MIYASIQQQELKDIEIIFIDDASTDNSSFVIKDLMKLDKRISYIKNNINKKQFYSSYERNNLFNKFRSFIFKWRIHTKY